MQAAAAFMTQSIPVIAPLLGDHVGFAPETIGTLSALVSFGSVLFLAVGVPVLARLGPVRMLQAGAVLAACAMLVACAGTLPALMLASLLLGVAYGPSPPAGSAILAATAPPRHRTLIFSVKQAGVPAGGMLAGLATPPLAASLGWRGALLGAGLASLAAAVAIAPQRAALDREREPDRAIDLASLFRPSAVLAPFAALGTVPGLLALAMLGVVFSVTQGCVFAFTVTWLVEVRGLDLLAAGHAFASMQAAGMVARIALGWLADRTGRAVLNLLVQGVVAAAVVAGFVLLPAGTSAGEFALAAAAVGFVAASWNGIYLAEIARLAPRGRVAEATSATTILTFQGYVFGPIAFAAAVRAGAGWTAPMLGVAALLAATCVLGGPGLLRATGPRGAG